MNAPRVEKRRKKEFAAELLARARAWIPDWEMDLAARDFGMALLDIAARFDSEVAERLDRSGQKNQRGLLDWLGIRGEAARAARVPVVLRLGERTLNPVAAKAPVKLRADKAAGPVMFETESDVMLVPGKLAALVAVDPAADAFFMPPPGIDNVEPQPVMPDSWRTKAFAAGAAARLQLDPELGLARDMLLQVNGAQYRVTAVDKDLVTLDPPIAAGAGVDANTVVTKVSAFAPFEPSARNRQRHALYIGDDALLDIKADATIAVHGLTGLPEGTYWEYWGKLGDTGSVGWQRLRPDLTGGALSLAKLKGSIEPYAINGVESRWIRAVIDKHLGDVITFDRLQLRINPGEHLNDWPSCKTGVSPEIEGVANNTPQVLNGVFYPFGREPRLNDTFYLGCAEAFSKKNAAVTICFDLADPTMTSVTVVPAGPRTTAMLAATGQDGYLHLIQLAGDGKATPLRLPVQPPSPKDGGTDAGKPPVGLDRQENGGDPPARAAAWSVDADFYVAVAAKSDVWVWHEQPPDKKQEPSLASGWINFGSVDSNLDPLVAITDLVVSGDSLFALRAGRLFRRPRLTDGDWREVVFEPALAFELAALVAVDDRAHAVADLPPLCALSKNGEAYFVWLSEKDVKGDKRTIARGDKLPDMGKLRPRVRPVAALRRSESGIQLAVTAVAEMDRGRDALVNFLSEPVNAGHLGAPWSPQWPIRRLPLDALVVGRDLEGADGERDFTVFAATEHALIATTPFGEQAPEALMPFPIQADLGIAGGGPVSVGPAQLILPGVRSDLLVATIKHAPVIVNLAPGAFGDALVVDSDVALTEGDIFAFPPADGGAVETSLVEADPVAVGKRLLHKLQTPLKKSPRNMQDAWLFMQQSHSVARGDEKKSLVIGELSPINADDYLLVSHGTTKKTINRIEHIKGEGEGRTATMAEPLPSGNDRVEFRIQIIHGARKNLELRSVLTVTLEASRAWTAASLKKYQVNFPGLQPSPQHVKEIKRDAKFRDLLLAQRLESRPSRTIDAYVEEPKADWNRQLGKTADNPLLSWEYWNGTGWWKLGLSKDETTNFQRRGNITLTVPDDLRASEWAGKTNFWIRARLVGGDYGREKVTAVTSPVDEKTGEQQQEVRRDPSNIHAPAVLHLELRYAVPPATPANVLTDDNGTTRDQSAANLAGGAIVEAFLPLREMLARFGSVPRQLADHAGAPPSPAPHAAAGRAVYLGLDGRIQGEGINILLLPSEEHDFDGFAPARIDVLRGTRFEPVIATDATRALGEAGILSITLASAPEPAELFGRTLAWLRIRPREGAIEKNWNPALRGAYLNAVWAEAAETQEFEMLGSSQGAPFQQVLLARPPVLRDTLELRVREPLGEEERDDLKQREPGSVRSDVASQPGDWVLWKQVADPADEDARARVYSLDEASGAIRFGDGVHGAIPPIARDAIMAFRYRRTDAAAESGAAAPANAVGAGSSLSIVTPVSGAEAAFAADQAAGGSPAEDIARILRFGPAHLRQRGAAVTARDLEEMALALLPEAAQARCLLRGPVARLVLVMRGAEPRPTRAARRELRRRLLNASAPALSAPGAFDVVGPVVVPFYARLTLAAATLEHSAGLADAVKKALAALFDPASGGRDGQGWPLGTPPTEVDIAASLLDLPHLDGIGSVELGERDAARRPTALRTAWRQDELAMLAADGVELQFALPQEAV